MSEGGVTVVQYVRIFFFQETDYEDGGVVVINRPCHTTSLMRPISFSIVSMVSAQVIQALVSGL